MVVATHEDNEDRVRLYRFLRDTPAFWEWCEKNDPTLSGNLSEFARVYDHAKIQGVIHEGNADEIAAYVIRHVEWPAMFTLVNQYQRETVRKPRGLVLGPVQDRVPDPYKAPEEEAPRETLGEAEKETLIGSVEEMESSALTDDLFALTPKETQLLTKVNDWYREYEDICTPDASMEHDTVLRSVGLIRLSIQGRGYRRLVTKVMPGFEAYRPATD